MGLQINKDLIVNNGLTVPSGSVLTWSTGFIVASLQIAYSPVLIFLSVQDRNNYYDKIAGALEPNSSANIENMLPYYDYTMTLIEYQALNTEIGVMDSVQDYLLSEIVSNSNGYLLSSDIVIIPSYQP
jgi:hypothetical protein